MGGVADGTSLSQRGMFKNERPSLLTMTLAAAFIQACHRQSAGRLENIAPVRIVALRAIHFLFQDGMMLRQVKLSFLRAVTFKTRGRILAGIHDEFAAS